MMESKSKTMDNIDILKNQVVIMTALLTIIQNKQVEKELRDQIIFTNQRIKNMS